MPRLPAALLAVLLLLPVAPPALAWGETGHRLVGTLAQEFLTPAAEREVERLLAGEAEPTLAGVSTWADKVRANDPVLGRRSAPWHYVGIKAADCGYNRATDCKGDDCVVEAIRAQTAILADRSQPIEVRRQALKFVVHFVGDAHQPLHANNRNDKGGNTVQLRVPTSKGGERGSNLHSFWDSGLIELAGRDQQAHLARLRATRGMVTLPRQPVPPPADAWAEQSCRIAGTPGFYPGSARVKADYARRWAPIADVRIIEAGAQLAHLLNATLGR